MQGWWRQSADAGKGPWEALMSDGLISRQRVEKCAVDVWIEYEIESEPFWYAENKDGYANLDFVWQGDNLRR